MLCSGLLECPCTDRITKTVDGALSAQAMGVTLFGTSEGAMTVHRFDDRRYGAMITGRIVNAFGCENCYFTPTAEAAKLGGSRDVPTLK